jgi:hypothetical protein
MFERFYRELFRSGAFTCREDGGLNRFVMVYARASASNPAGRQEYVVDSNEERTEFFCVCKSFEHCGIPCRHVLKVSVTSSSILLEALVFVASHLLTIDDTKIIMENSFTHAGPRSHRCHGDSV